MGLVPQHGRAVKNVGLSNVHHDGMKWNNNLGVHYSRGMHSADCLHYRWKSLYRRNPGLETVVARGRSRILAWVSEQTYWFEEGKIR